MAGELCEQLRESVSELRRAAEHHDSAVGQRQREVEAAPGDASAQAALQQAFQEKCDHMSMALREEAQTISERVDDIRRGIDSDAARAQELDGAHPDSKAERGQLRQQLEDSRDRLRAARDAESAAHKEREAAAARAKAARRQASLYQLQEPFDYQPGHGAAYRKFVAQRRQLRVLLQQKRTRFAYFAAEACGKDGTGFDPVRAAKPVLAELEEEVERWLGVATNDANNQLRALEGAAQALRDMYPPWPAEHCDVSQETELLDEVDTLADRWDRKLKSAKHATATQQAAVEEFLQKDAKLLQWCRQERTNLEALTDPNHVQEFCASLIQNIGTMDDNFNHLADMAESLLPNKEVEKALVEVSEVWLNLQLYAYERQRTIMLEIHAVSRWSKLEDEVRAFSGFQDARDPTDPASSATEKPGWTGKLDAWLSGSPNSVKETLEKATDAESRSVVRAPLQQCAQLKREFEPFRAAAGRRGLAGQLQDFSLRMEKIRDNYTVLRKSVFGRLTFLSGDRRAVTDAAEQRRREFAEKVDDVKGWAQGHDAAPQWSEMRERIVALRQRLDHALGSDEDPPPADRPAVASGSHIVSSADLVAAGADDQEF